MRVPLPPSLRNTPVAHRALHDKTDGRPENSRAAIMAAITADYAIEIDVQMSADGVAMVFHDETLDRLTGEQGPVAQRNAADLSRIRLNHASDGIPTLAEVLALVAGQVPLLIEIKDQTGSMGRSDGRLEAAVAAALAGYRGDVAVMSFNPHTVATMATLLPDIPRGLITSAYDPDDWSPLPTAICDALREIPDFDRTDASFVSHQADDLTRPRVRALQDQGADVLCWTIRSPEQEAEARRIACNITFEGYLAAHTA
jgi:glycerophosphoryl diester phosphodiesterase